VTRPAYFFFFNMQKVLRQRTRPRAFTVEKKEKKRTIYSAFRRVHRGFS